MTLSNNTSVKFVGRLLDYQSEGVQFIHEKKYCLIGDEPGLGKTAQALKACADRGFKTLIICPAYLRMNWINEVAKFTPYLEYEVQSYSAAKLPTGFDAVILDESSYIKNLKAKRTVRIHRYIYANKPQYCILLNGSPIMNRVEELYSQITLILPEVLDVYPSVWSWLNKFANRKVLRYGSQEYVRYEGHKNVDALKLILKKCMVRRRVKDVLSLPPINQNKVVVKYGEDKALQQAWDDYIAGRSVGDNNGKKDSAIAKAPFTAQFVLDLCTSGSVPLVVFSCHPDAVDIIHKELTDKALRFCKVTGATKMSDREKYVKWLQEGKIEGIVATIGSFNTGWTGTKANTMVFNDISFVPEENTQAAKRIHRIGQDRPVFYYFVVGSKVDDRIIDAVQSKKEIINAVMN